MALLSEQDQEHLRNEFAGLQQPVNLIVFTQEFECQYCRETRQITEEVAELSDNISLEIYDFVADKEIADQYNIDKIPATIIMAGGDEPLDYGIRYYGIPSGYEFSSLIHDILMVGEGIVQLAGQIKNVSQVVMANRIDRIVGRGVVQQGNRLANILAFVSRRNVHSEKISY